MCFLVEPDREKGFHLDVEDYLSGVLILASELVRSVGVGCGPSVNVHVEAQGQTCCHSLCWPPFFFFRSVCVRACAMESAWKSQDEF